MIPIPVETTHDRLGRLSRAHGMPGLGRRLDEALAGVGPHLAEGEALLQRLAAGGDVAAIAARHLVAAGGKRVRPILTLLAAQAADGGSPAETTVSLAAVAEAVHAATLLHDDVIDAGEIRRGVAAARVVYGNAASVLGGDLLLVRALGLVEATGVDGLVASVLDLLDRMIAAEALQLERRGRASLTRAEYDAIVSGKTASLFAWAASAGARSVGRAATDPAVAALSEFGHETGVAFQITDDLLDLTGDPTRLGKGILTDVREGKVTFPLIHALECEPELAEPLEAAARGEPCDPESLGRRLRDAAERGGGIEAARAEVVARTGAAVAALQTLPPSAAREALASVSRSLAVRSA